MPDDPVFDDVFEQSSDPVFVLDPLQDRILAANRVACAMLGYTRGELLATPISHVHPAEMPQMLDFIRRVRHEGRGSTVKLTCRTKWGDFLPAEIAMVALVNRENVYILALVQDRSEHRHVDPGE
jgi:PAS domain S-box-containing protein